MAHVLFGRRRQAADLAKQIDQALVMGFRNGSRIGDAVGRLIACSDLLGQLIELTPRHHS
jgi:hypothetical protein